VEGSAASADLTEKTETPAIIITAAKESHLETDKVRLITGSRRRKYQ
jgi:hypothetical protein